MKRKKIPGQKFAAISSATAEMVHRFTRTQEKKHGPTLKNFLLDLNSTGLSSPWNKHAVVIFADHFLSLKKYACLDEELIEQTFTTHMIQLKAQYKAYINGQEKSEEVSNREMRNARLARRRNVCFGFPSDC
jgi:hypothetical protein